MLKKILLAALFLFVAMPVVGEYYQYKDAQGNLRFTDNPANVPEDQQPNLKTFESVQTTWVPESARVVEPAGKDSEPVLNQREISQPSSSDTWEEKIQGLGRELDTMRVELSQTAESLREQQKALEAQAPGKQASSKEKIAYSEKVEALNAEIEAYNKQRQVFNEKVKAFNAQILGESRANRPSE
ncbi:MAG: DUF4124 domain-containing protein [Dissulfuribacterales bacterium]